MSIVWKVVVTLAALAIACVVNPACVFACSCLPPGPPADALASATSVFSGRVAALSGAVDAGGSDPVQVTFAISKVWKGTDQPTIEVLTPASSASCGFEFVQGEEYLVYASESEGQLQTNLCSRTALLAMADDDLAVLGAGSTPSSADEAQTPTTLPATGDDTIRSHWQPALIAAGALMLIALGVVVVRRARSKAAATAGIR
jgi:hypothetical protein